MEDFKCWPTTHTKPWTTFEGSLDMEQRLEVGVPGSNPHRGVCEMSVRLYNRVRGRTFICRSGPSRTQGGVGGTNFLFLPPSPFIFTGSFLGFTMFGSWGWRNIMLPYPNPPPPPQNGWHLWWTIGSLFLMMNTMLGPTALWCSTRRSVDTNSLDSHTIQKNPTI